MSDETAVGRHRLNHQALQNFGRVIVMFAAIVLLAWMEWRFALQ